MNAFILYAVKTIACAAVLFCYYWFALRNKAFHQYNRFYLLLTFILSLVLPLIEINIWHTENTTTPVIRILQAVEIPVDSPAEIILTKNTNDVSPELFALYAYVIICAIFLYRFIISVVKIVAIYRRNEKRQFKNVTLVLTDDKASPFSFLNLIFLNRNTDIGSAAGRHILKHEMAHAEYKHSYDKLFINTVMVVCWFNPFLWLARKELNMIHEFTADKKAIHNSDAGAFAAMLLQAAYPSHHFDLSNSFFYSPIKRRLMMLTKKNNTTAGYFTRLAALPVTVILFAAFTLKPKQLPVAKHYDGKKITVVIDAGHGGRDNGATNGSGLFEKNITLAIAKKIKELNTNNNISIVLSRETDIYQTPQEKANYINQKGASLAVVLHVDGTIKDSFDLKSGLSAWVARDQYPNAAGSKIAASVMLQSFIANYPLPVSAAPLQRKNSIWILQASTCPTVLLEAGFITNKKDAAFLNSAGGQEIIAKNILNGIEQYAHLQNDEDKDR